MKTRIEIANTKIDKINQELKEFYDRKIVLKKAKLEEFKQVSNKYFLDCLEEGDDIDTSDSRIEFLRQQEGYSYKKEILNLYLRDNWQTDEIRKIETSFYSTTDNSEFELRRMILLGKVGQVLLDFSDDIVGELNLIIDKYSKELKEVNSVIYNLENQIRDIKKDIDKFEKENLLSKVEKEGIEFEIPEGMSMYELPDIDVKFNSTIYNIKGLQIISKTASGKSADLRLKTMNSVWNPDTQSYNEKEVIKVVEKVRMDNIERFLRYNSYRISVS